MFRRLPKRYSRNLFYKKPKTSSIAKHYGALILAYLIWAAAGPVIKVTLQYIPPFTFLFFRLLIVCIVMLPYVVVELKHDSIHRKDILKVGLLGLLSQTSLIFIFLGLNFTSVLDATIIGLLGPILSVAAGHYFYNEKTNWHIKLGLLIATLGTIFVAFEPLFLTKADVFEIEKRLFGNLMVILNSLAFLLYIIWSKISLGKSSKNVRRTLHALHLKPMIKKYSPILLTAISFYVGLASFIPMAILELSGYFGDINFELSQVPLGAVLGVFYMALLSSIVAYILFEWSLEEVEVKDTALFSYLSPIFTLPFAYIMLGEVPNKYMIIGGMVIAIGVAIAEYKKS